MGRFSQLRRMTLVIVVNLALAAMLSELTIYALLRMPSVTARTPPVVRGFAQKVYRHFQRTLIQFYPPCAQYDSALGYTLKPGTCTFGNLEFSNEFRINSRGLRDTEAALSAPEIVFLGDSQAMGWGVPQDRAMPQVLASVTGLTVLNAGVSSYGTVREASLLRTLDRSKLRAVVIQYCDNDSPENQAFVAAGNRLVPMTASRYREASALVANEHTYYPGKYVFRLGLKALHLEAAEADPARLDAALTPAEEARLFVRALIDAGPADLDHVTFVVFEVNSNLGRPRHFIRALDEIRRDPAYPAYIRNMTALETEGQLGREDFYVLDDHLTVRGNDRLAHQIAQVLTARQITPAADRRP